MSAPASTVVTEGPLRVRRARVDDAPAIARVHVAAWRCAYRGLMPDALLAALDEGERTQQWRRWIEPDTADVFVAERGEVLIGFCSVVPTRDADAADATGELMALYVAPEHWRVGAGALLMNASIGRARQRGYRALTLWVLASNQRARSFYERFGWVADGASQLKAIGGHALHELRYRVGWVPL